MLSMTLNFLKLCSKDEPDPSPTADSEPLALCAAYRRSSMKRSSRSCSAACASSACSSAMVRFRAFGGGSGKECSGCCSILWITFACSTVFAGVRIRDGEVARRFLVSKSCAFESSNIVRRVGRGNRVTAVVCAKDCDRFGIGVEARTDMSQCRVSGVGCSTVVKILGPIGLPSLFSSFFSTASGGSGVGNGTIGDGHIHWLWV